MPPASPTPRARRPNPPRRALASYAKALAGAPPRRTPPRTPQPQQPIRREARAWPHANRPAGRWPSARPGGSAPLDPRASPARQALQDGWAIDKRQGPSWVRLGTIHPAALPQGLPHRHRGNQDAPRRYAVAYGDPGSPGTGAVDRRSGRQDGSQPRDSCRETPHAQAPPDPLPRARSRTRKALLRCRFPCHVC